MGIHSSLESTYVVLHGFLRRVEFFVVAATTARVDESAADAANQQTIVDTEFDHRIQGSLPLFQQGVQLQN